MSDINRTVKLRVNLGRAIISEVKSVNSVEPDNSGDIKIYAGDIKMSSEQGSQTIEEAMESIGDRDASEIIYENETTIKTALDDINEELSDDMTEQEMDDMIDEIFGGEE